MRIAVFGKGAVWRKNAPGVRGIALVELSSRILAV